MSKSNATEIIAILWLIAATQLTGFWHGFLIGFFVWNCIESIYWAIKDKHVKGGGE